MANVIPLFGLEPEPEPGSHDGPCLLPQLKGTTAYREGCRCQRCRVAKDANRRGICEIPGCDVRRNRGSSLCASHQHEQIQARKQPLGTRHEFVCEKCGRTFGQYESVILNQREDLQDLHRRACQGCRKVVAPQIRNHGLNADWAMRLLLAETCDICGGALPITTWGKVKAIVDHDHACCPTMRSCGNCIRGIVCQDCNVALGWLERVLRMGTLDQMLAYLSHPGGAGAGVPPGGGGGEGGSSRFAHRES